MSNVCDLKCIIKQQQNWETKNKKRKKRKNFKWKVNKWKTTTTTKSTQQKRCKIPRWQQQYTATKFSSKLQYVNFEKPIDDLKNENLNLKKMQTK